MSNPSAGRRLAIVRLGTCDYARASALQARLVELRAGGSVPDTLLLLEHPAVITRGRSAPEAHVRASGAALLDAGVAVADTNRGGDVTLHNPGQLVGYPIVDLHTAICGEDLHGYLRHVEEALIQGLDALGIEGFRFPPYTGVWTNRDAPAKVAAIGIHVTRWVTSHGFALNVCNDLSQFNLIVPCGISDHGVTSISQLLGRDVAIQDIEPAVVRAFERVFRAEAIDTPLDTLIPD